MSEYFFEHEPLCRQLFITCNEGGSLALRHKSDRRAHSLLLDDRTNDRSLVMTSSFTSMVLAGRFLACLDRTVQYRDAARRLSDAARRLILEHAEELAAAVRDDFGYALYLGAGCRFGAAREAGLKMMEMSAGRVRTMAETYMGLRHGPMAAVGNAAPSRVDLSWLLLPERPHVGASEDAVLRVRFQTMTRETIASPGKLA